VENKFYSLKGLRVFSVDKDVDSCEVKFDGDISLSIYNLCSVTDFDEKAIESLSGMVVNDILIDQETFRLVFDRLDKSFDVDLRDSAFRGPEAMVLRIPDQPIFVWV